MKEKIKNFKLGKKIADAFLKTAEKQGGVCVMNNEGLYENVQHIQKNSSDNTEKKGSIKK